MGRVTRENDQLFEGERRNLIETEWLEVLEHSYTDRYIDETQLIKAPRSRT